MITYKKRYLSQILSISLIWCLVVPDLACLRHCESDFYEAGSLLRLSFGGQVGRQALAQGMAHFSMRQVPVQETREVTAIRIEEPRNYEGKIIVIGASAGGYEGLLEILKRLPEDHPPIIVCEHIYPRGASGRKFNGFAQNSSRDIIQDDNPGIYYLKRGMVLISRSVIVNIDSNGYPVAKINGNRGKIDDLFTSAGEHFGNNAICVVLSGVGDDGVEGARVVQQKKGVVLVQKVEVRSGTRRHEIPFNITKAGIDHAVYTVEELAGEIMKAVGQTQSAAAPAGAEAAGEVVQVVVDMPEAGQKKPPARPLADTQP